MRTLSSVLSTSFVGLVLFACGSDGEPATNPRTTDEPSAPGVDPTTDVSPTNSHPNDSTAPVGPDGPVDPDPGVNPDPGVSPVAPKPSEAHPPTLAACEAPAVGSPTLRLLTRFEFQNTIDDVFPGIAGQWASSMPSNLVTEAGFDNDRSAVLGGQAGEGLLRTAESIGDAVAGALDSLLPCASRAAQAACAGEFIDTYGKRLFRRPLEGAERERYLNLFDTALAQTDFATAIKWVTAGLVQSPNAMYRSELGAEQADGTRALTPYEVATQLAYTFTGTTPSEELLAQAEAGQLTDLVATAKSLIRTEDGRQALHRFFEAYTAYTRAPTKQKPNVRLNINPYELLSQHMVKETKAFLDDVLFTQSGTLHDLLTNPQTHPSRLLAEFYGLPIPSEDYTPVERPAGQGVGLLAQGAFLASHSNADASSPTQRGLFAYTKILCRAEPPLPDDVPSIDEVSGDANTTRQRYEELHAKGTCAGCHSLFDPIGFAFEHFDEGGRYRADENGFEIDPTGYLQSKAGERLDFASQEDLATALASLPEVHECFAAYLSTYAFGTSESCLGAGQVPALQTGDISIVDAFASLAAEPHFTQRVVK